ncbi:peptidoglycan-binding domain-containing protein [Ancylobacter radicis]|uniref:Peptidoglycan-binding protein n=1 Tax=Ancylobacter radicis TaxID=2836179 RepID=A0ABS5RAX2_9HYPH|nr:peptidoglycan-binding domain-containing protein [Ancylobacter radicis]MBS9478810.1 peptidoglycan-binding protein [Ancylobacter radicis]
MPRSYASDLLVDDIDLHGERIAGRPYRSGRRRSDVFMLFLAAVASAGFLFNALMLQGPRRDVPKPMNAPNELRTIPTPPAVQPAPPSLAPAASAVSPAPSVAEPVAAPAPPLPPVKPAAPPPPRAAAPAAANPIAAASPAPIVPPADVAVSARVMEVQKALARLGYGPIRIDGRTGEATREAILRFERDRRLPVTGEISDRLVRELNAVAGFSIQ